MKRIIFATGNENKLKEIREIMAGTDYVILSMKEAGISAEPEEDGETFEENALIKARAVAALLRDQAAAAEENTAFSDTVVLADDSGLEIDFLDKAPGVHSARFMGHETPYEKKNRALLEKLSGVPEEKRTARFVCAIAAVDLGGGEDVVRGTMEGQIAMDISGENGFGYDPIFYLPAYGCTSAALSPEEKNKISHRGQALREMRKHLTAKKG